jgi:hypothetical protein
MDRGWFVINIVAIGCRHLLPVREWSIRDKMADEQRWVNLVHLLVDRTRRTRVQVAVDIDGLLELLDNENITRVWIGHRQKIEDENQRFGCRHSRRGRTSTSS